VTGDTNLQENQRIDGLVQGGMEVGANHVLRKNKRRKIAILGESDLR